MHCSKQKASHHCKDEKEIQVKWEVKKEGKRLMLKLTAAQQHHWEIPSEMQLHCCSSMNVKQLGEFSEKTKIANIVCR